MQMSIQGYKMKVFVEFYSDQRKKHLNGQMLLLTYARLDEKEIIWDFKFSFAEGKVPHGFF